MTTHGSIHYTGIFMGLACYLQRNGFFVNVLPEKSLLVILSAINDVDDIVINLVDKDGEAVWMFDGRLVSCRTIWSEHTLQQISSDLGYC
jgi:hypothetical protein